MYRAVRELDGWFGESRTLFDAHGSRRVNHREREVTPFG